MPGKSIIFGAAFLVNAARTPGITGAGGSGSTNPQRDYVQTAGTFSNLSVHIITAISSSRTVRLQKNGANVNQTVTLPADTSGWFEDVTNTDVFAAGDYVTASYSYPGVSYDTGGTRIRFTPTSGDYASVFGQASTGGNLGPVYYPIDGGNLNGQATSTDPEETIKVAGTAKRFYVYLSGNSSTAAATYTLRKNNADTALAVTVPSSTTGSFTDTTDTLAFAIDDKIAVKLTGNNANHSPRVGCSYERTVAKQDLFLAGNGSRNASATVHIYAWGRDIASDLTIETHAKKIGYGVKASNIRIKVTSNSYTASADLKSRVNAVDGTQLASIPNATTGVFEDNSNIDNVGATDDLAMSISGGTSGTLAFTNFGMSIEEAVAALTRNQAMVYG